MDWLTAKLQALKNKFSEYSKWSFIRKLQNESLLKATYVWFVVVPIMARFLSKLEDEVTLTIGAKTYTFLLDLPFSWKLLYIASLAFIIANILYRLFAPAIIKENADFGEFERAGKSDRYMVSYMTEEIKRDLNKTYPYYLGETETTKIDFIFEAGISRPASNVPLPESELRKRRIEIFEHVYEVSSVKNILAIYGALFSLAVTAILSFVVTAQQIWHVFKFICEHGVW